MKKIFASLLLALASLGASAQDCTMPVTVLLDEDFAGVPSSALSVLYNSLNRIVTENGFSTEGSTPFVITAHCDVLDKSNLPGPPIKTVYNLGLTLYFADSFTQKKFATAYITLNGVGNGEVKSYIDAFRRINANNAEVKSLIKRGREGMIGYYDTEYHNIIKEAKRLESLQQFEEAMALVLAIPVCTKGGDEATTYGVLLYTRHLDRMNLYLLNQARALWAANQDQATAYGVCSMLAQIDPEAKCYGEASALMKEVKSQVRSDIDFEMREKYHDQIKLESDRIAAARAIGVAFGNNQKPTTTNLAWLR